MNIKSLISSWVLLMAVCIIPAVITSSGSFSTQRHSPAFLLQQLDSIALSLHTSPSCIEMSEIYDIQPPTVCQLLSHNDAGTLTTVPGVEPSQALSLLDPPSTHKRSRRMIDSYVKEDVSVAQLLSAIVSQELRECVLLVAADEEFRDSQVMNSVITLPNLRQVVYIRSRKDLLRVVWKAQQCRAYLFLLRDPAPLFQFADQMTDIWDYHGRFVIVGLSRDQLQALTLTKKGRKTEHITGVVETDDAGKYPQDASAREYVVLTNVLYQRETLVHLFTWKWGHMPVLPVKLFPDKTTDLQGAALVVVTFDFPPSVVYQRSADGVVLRRYGHDVELVRTLARVFNFTVRFREPPPGEMWGELTANGTWNGMVGMLGRGEGDIGVANLFITALGGRREFQEFTRPYDQEVSCYLVRREGLLPRWQSLALPFHLSTWLAVLLGLSISGPLLYCLAKPTISSEKLARRSLASISLYTYGMHFRSTQSVVPARASLQVLVVFLWLYVIIITTGYSCNLTAFLTVERKPPGIRTLKELYHSQLHVFGLGPFFGNTMAESKNEYLRGLAKRFLPLSDFEDISSRLLKGEGVMIQARRYLAFSSAHLTTERGQPTVRIIQECFLPFNVAMGLQSHSPLKKNFDHVVSWVFESGLVNYWFQQTLILSTQYKREEGRERGERREGKESTRVGVPSLHLEHVQGAFLILVFGYVASFLVFLREAF